MQGKGEGFWSFCSVYAVARGIARQHEVDWDQAFRMAWYGMRANEAIPTWAEALSRMQKVVYVPEVPESVFLMFQKNLRRRLKGDV